MTTNSGELLRMLGSGVRPVEASRAGRAPAMRAGQFEGAGFGDLLNAAEAGGLSSGQRVTVAKNAGVQLTDDQLGRLALAADRAEGAGAKSVLVLIDGQSLRLDVASRTITGRADLASGMVLTGIDGVVTIPGKDDPAGAGARVMPLPGGGAPASNPSLLKLLAEGRSGERAA